MTQRRGRKPTPDPSDPLRQDEADHLSHSLSRGQGEATRHALPTHQTPSHRRNNPTSPLKARPRRGSRSGHERLQIAAAFFCPFNRYPRIQARFLQLVPVYRRRRKLRTTQYSLSSNRGSLNPPLLHISRHVPLFLLSTTLPLLHRAER